MQPDSTKSDSQKTKDKASGGMDSALGSMQPDSMKSDSQKAGDKGQGMFQQAKDTVTDTFSGDNSKFCCGTSSAGWQRESKVLITTMTGKQ
jgi:hypothetical protein